MKSIIALAWITIFVGSSSENRFLRDSINYRRLKELVLEIAQSMNSRDVFILIENRRADAVGTQVVSAVCETASKFLPTMSVDVTRIPRSLDGLATSDSLVIYVYASRVSLRSESWEKMVSNVLNVSLSNHTPKILFLLVEDGSDSSVQNFLEYLWIRKIIQVEILEILTADGDTTIVAHRYNPFLNSYTKEYDPRGSLSWFSDKIKKPYRKPMCYQRIKELNATYTPPMYAYIFRQVLVNILYVKMNFSIDSCDGLTEDDMYPSWYNYLHKLDETANYVNTFLNVEMCLLTPILSMKTVILWNFINAICLGAVIVIVFLVATRLLRIDERLRRVMYLVNLLLGFSVTRLPTTFRDRVLFLCLVIVSIMYTSMFYTEFFELMFVRQEYKINDFEDLVRSGLTVMVDDVVYPEFLNASHIPWGAKKNMLPWKGRYNEGVENIELFANRSYFLERDVAEVIQKSRRDASGQQLFKLNNLCLEIHTAFLVLAKRSPYKEYIDDTALRMITGGFMNQVEKTMSTQFTLVEALTKNEVPATEQNFEIPFPFLILLSGLSLSFLAFLGEAFVHKLFRRKRSVR